MRSLFGALTFMVIGLAWADPAPQPPAGMREIALNGHVFTLPLGFEIELAAGPPIVDRPITADFDERGRLYVADSSGSNDKVEQQLKDKPHRIVRLEDVDGDGRFDRRCVFADQMMFPEGTMWLAGSLYVAAPPSIWKLTDTDGDGTADQRVEWFQGKTLTGCANDLHGPYRGPDGWIYWCKGAFARQTYERPGKPPFVTRAAHIFRARPDGSGLEPVMTGGMDNPVDVVFTPGGERIFTTTFLQHPAGGRRDGLIHAIYGGVYGKDHDPVHEHPWTGPSLMPVLVHLGPAAPAGLLCYESEAFGPEFHGNLFAACFNLQKVTRHVLTPSGSTFISRDEDFLVSSNRDFHPTDVLEDADGSLLVIDTGGWYKLCCPSSQLHKPDLLGAIYRIRRVGAPRLDDPRGRNLDLASLTPPELALLLGDSRPVMRRRAAERLAAKGEESVPALSTVLAPNSPPEARRQALWTACRISSPSARALIRLSLADPDETVRQVAIHAAGLWRDRAAVAPLLGQLNGPHGHNRRAAAEALGRIGDPAAAAPLLEALGSRPEIDRALEHSLIYALIEIADQDALRKGLESAHPSVRRGAMIALDQIPGGKLESVLVLKALAAGDAATRETALWIAGRRLDWGPELIGFFRQRLSTDLRPEEQEEMTRLLARFARGVAMQRFLAELLRGPDGRRPERQIALRAMAQAGLREIPDGWMEAILSVLKSDDQEQLREAAAAVKALPWAKKKTDTLTAALARIGQEEKYAPATRLAALAATPGGVADLEPAAFQLIIDHLSPDRPVLERSLAADVLSRSRLAPPRLLALCAAVKTLGPMELERVLDAFAQSTDEKAGLALLDALKEATARSSLRVDAIRSRLAKYSPAVQKRAEQLYAELDADVFRQRAQLEHLLASLEPGDIRRGQAVFNSPKAACINCHAVGYLGGRIGPDLTHIGRIRGDRDLLEAIVFPSASLVRSYEPMVVSTRQGKLHNGLVKKDAPDEVVLTLGADQEVRIPREEIEAMQPSKVSIMPAGLDQQLTPRDLADLLAFLKACK